MGHGSAKDQERREPNIEDTGNNPSRSHWVDVGGLAWLGTPLSQRLIPLRLPSISLKPTPIHFAGAGAPPSRYKASLDLEGCFRCDRALQMSHVGQVI